MKLDASEKHILASVEKGEWRAVPGLNQQRKRYRGYAAATFRKERRVNIRISGKDLEALGKKSTGRGSAVSDADIKPHPQARFGSVAGNLIALLAILVAIWRFNLDRGYFAVF